MARLRQALERELRANENVLWHGWQLGRIDHCLFLTYAFAVPWNVFSLAWTGIAAGAVASMGEDGPGLVALAFPLFGLPFIAVGVWMLSRPFAPLLERGQVLYVISEQQVLKLSLGRTLAISAARRRGSGLPNAANRPMARVPCNSRCGSGRTATATGRPNISVDGVMGAQQAIDHIAPRRDNPRPAAALSS